MGSTRVLRFLTAVSALSASAGAVQAQRYWHDDQGRDAYRIDAWLPFLKGDGHKFFTGVLVPSASIKVGEGIRFEADLPMMRAGQDLGGTAGKQNAFRMGNPYVGIRIGDDAKLVSATLGSRIAVSQNPDDAIAQQAVSAAVLANFDDYEAFAANILTFRGALEFHRVSASHFLLGVRGAGSMQVNTSGDPTRDSEMSFDYGARMGYEGGGAVAYVALTGRYLITAPRAPVICPPTGACDARSFDARTDHHLSGTVELRPGHVRPRVTLRIPLDKARREDGAGAILGVGVSIAR